MKHKHLTLSDRIEIELGITQGFSFRKIASIIEKDPSTVSKEIKKLKRNYYMFSNQIYINYA